MNLVYVAASDKKHWILSYDVGSKHCLQIGGIKKFRARFSKPDYVFWLAIIEYAG